MVFAADIFLEGVGGTADERPVSDPFQEDWRPLSVSENSGLEIRIHPSRRGSEDTP